MIDFSRILFMFQTFIDTLRTWEFAYSVQIFIFSHKNIFFSLRRSFVKFSFREKNLVPKKKFIFRHGKPDWESWIRTQDSGVWTFLIYKINWFVFSMTPLQWIEKWNEKLIIPLMLESDLSLKFWEWEKSLLLISFSFPGRRYNFFIII